MFPLGFCMENGKLWFHVCRTPKAPDSLMGCHFYAGAQNHHFSCAARRNVQHNLCGSSAAAWALLKLQISAGRGVWLFLAWALGTRGPQENLCPKSLVWLVCASWGTHTHHGCKGWGHQTSVPWSCGWKICEALCGSKRFLLERRWKPGTAVLQGMKGYGALLLVFNLSGSAWWYTEANSLFLPSPCPLLHCSSPMFWVFLPSWCRVPARETTHVAFQVSVLQ